MLSSFVASESADSAAVCSSLPLAILWVPFGALGEEIGCGFLIIVFASLCLIREA